MQNTIRTNFGFNLDWPHDFFLSVLGRVELHTVMRSQRLRASEARGP
jgi:hypothetical protein